MYQEIIRSIDITEIKAELAKLDRFFVHVSVTLFVVKSGLFNRTSNPEYLNK
jgi:hypothetical protein